MFVTELATRIDYEIQDFADAKYLYGKIGVICHGRQSVINAIERNSRFFISVFTEGKLLCSEDGTWDVGLVPFFIPKEVSKKTLKHDEHRMPLAVSFLSCALGCLEKEHFGTSTFMLHQVVEQTCIGLISVHIAYRSDFQNLHRLFKLCRCFSDIPYKLFLSSSEDLRLFDIMAKSYFGARYKDGFSVSASDAHCLYHKTLSFTEQAKMMSVEKIELLA